MKKGYKLCPYCGEEIKEIAKKCRFCGEFLEEKKLETKSRIKKEIKSELNKGKEWNYDLCFYCQRNKPNSNCSKTIKLSHVITHIPLAVARYVKTEGAEIVIPRCSECYERQQKKLKKSIIKCFGIASIIGLLFAISSYNSETGNFLTSILIFIAVTGIFGGLPFFMVYPKTSESFRLSERPERKNLKGDGWQMEA